MNRTNLGLVIRMYRIDGIESLDAVRTNIKTSKTDAERICVRSCGAPVCFKFSGAIGIYKLKIKTVYDIRFSGIFPNDDGAPHPQCHGLSFVGRSVQATSPDLSVAWRKRHSSLDVQANRLKL